MKSSGVLGIFAHLDTTVQAVRELRRQGFHDVIVQSPVPRHELLEALERKTSPVRLWTLIGGLLGCASGFALTIWTSVAWPLRTSAKPIVSIPPFVVIAFELTILFGGIATLLGLLVHARLPRLGDEIAFDPRFTEDHFGIFVRCDAAGLTAAQEALQALGAKEVRVEKV
jgi:hypothetical protein